MSSMPQTPPDIFSDDAVNFAFRVSQVNASSEGPAVEGSLSVAEISGKDSARTDNASSETSALTSKDAFDPLLLAAVLATDPHLSHHHAWHAFDSGHGHGMRMHDWAWVDGQAVRSHQVSHNVRGHSHTLLNEEQSSLSSPTGSPSFEPSAHTGRGVFSLPITPLRLSRDSSVSGSSTPSTDYASLANEVGTEDSATFSATSDTTNLPSTDVQVKCMVRTRVPTPHGEVFLHLYHNNRDNKEHLAIVVDPAQLDSQSHSRPHAPYIRSKSLNAVWDEDETAMDRVTRGAYVGRLSEAGYTVSTPEDADQHASASSVPEPLVRIHSECFTGETIGSMRCDCGEQLDEAIRRISQDIEYKDGATGETLTIPGRGAVIYMRQEGRGIGLLSKLRAYNLQDLGYDTVQANLMLGHDADERGYDVAAAIMHDLGLGVGDTAGGVRLLTNNPDKVAKLTGAGVQISEQVDMVPRAWRCQQEDAMHISNTLSKHMKDDSEEAAARLRSAGATLIGGSVTHGPELEKYLRTKVLRMGHMLSLPSA